MSEQETEVKERTLKIHTQYLVATTSVAKPLGWAPGDPIKLHTTRSGRVSIENLQDPEVIAQRAKAYADEQAAKEAEKKAKAEAKKAAEAKKKAEKEAEAAEEEESEEAAEEESEEAEEEEYPDEEALEEDPS